MKLLIIISFAIFQALYDYLFWNIIFHESDNGSYSRKIYRICKEIIDIPVTWYLMTYQFVEPTNMVAAFFVFKLFGGIDFLYVCIWKLFHSGETYTHDGIYWLWFTPKAWLRNEILYNPRINADETHLYFKLWGKTYLKKAIINLDEFIYELIFGTLASIGIIIFL